jgi:hypothetical protein
MNALFHEIPAYLTQTADNGNHKNLKRRPVHILFNLRYPTHPSFIHLLHIKTVAIMPCVFAGIFYVETFSASHQLECHFKDEDNVVRHLTLTHFQSPNTVNHPFPDAFEMVQTGSVYFIAGTFAIHNKKNLLVTPCTI